MAYRTRKNHLNYARFTKKAKSRQCDFCSFKPNHDQVVKNTKYFWVATNIFPYDFWDTTGVNHHLMVVPKRHVDTISHFKPEEQTAYVKLLGTYEKEGYSIYARAPQNAIKSVAHQHTHLILTDNKPKRILFVLKKPRIVLFK